MATSRSLRPAVLGIATLYIGSTLLTPLYPIYQREFGFSELTVTEIYAVYVIGNLAVLFLFGRISDQLGRRPTALAALSVTALSAISFLVASNSVWLFVGRVLSGFAAGLGAAALTAWLAELEPDRVRAAAVTSAGNLAGLSFGALAAGLLAAFGPAPLRSSWVLYLLLLGAAGGLLRSAPETVKERVTTWGELSLRPRIGIPQGLRTPFLGSAALAFASFALGGFYAALAPGLLMRRMGQSNLAVVGGVVALFFGAAAITASAARRLPRKATLRGAVGLLLLGLALLMLSDSRGTLGLLLIGTIGAGAAMALGYRGSLQIVDEIAPEDKRAELLSTYLLVCYTGNSLPVVGVGLLSTAAGPETAHRVFAVVLAVLGLVAGAIGGLGRGQGRRQARGRAERRAQTA
ncbi:MAG TPA: MFS transporter [Gemmatimonadales bacterium]|jgi:MFS family permease